VFSVAHGFDMVDERILLAELATKHEGEVFLDSSIFVEQHFSVTSLSNQK
jgi:hypothetical protein